MKSLILLTVTALAAILGADASCCKTCSKGKPCGDGCISKSATCSKNHGCACYAQDQCTKRCNPAKSYPCGNSCIALNKECSKTHGTACWKED